MRYFRALTLYILASFALHGVLFGLAYALVPQIPPKFQSPVVVDLLESPELPRRPKQSSSNTKQFVREAPIPKELLTDKKQPTDFASKEERYVLEQMRARNSGMTENRLPDGSSEFRSFTPRPKSRKSAGKEKLDLSPTTPLERMEEVARAPASLGEGDVVIGEQKEGAKPKGQSQDGSRELIFPSFVGAERGYSTVGEDLPESIKFGDFTVLNTDRHLFYAYYARMEEAIRPRWVSYAKAVLYNFATGAQKLTGNETWTTELEIELDAEGRFLKATLRQGSGIKGLDAAPVQAFRDAQQFPNPPREMIKEDGRIHIEYAFAVNIVPTNGGNDDF